MLDIYKANNKKEEDKEMNKAKIGDPLEQIDSKEELTIPEFPGSVLYLEPSNSSHLRIEALKLAYEVAHKMNTFSSASDYATKPDKVFEEDLKHVFSIADMNYQYLTGKK